MDDKLTQEYDEIKKMSQADAEAYLNELEGCTHDCSSCSSNCSENPNLTPRKAKRILAVYSGKGGVGVSAVTVQLASALVKHGKKVGILDADVSGCSIPHMMGLTELASNDGEKINPLVAKNGVEVVSMAAVTAQPEEPLLYPGEELVRMAGFFYIGANWSEDLDIMLIDIPGGASDLVLDFFTTIPFDGSIIVTEPGRLAVNPVKRAMHLSGMLMIPVMGLVENFSDSPEQGHITELYGDFPLLAAVPYSRVIADAVDAGTLPDCDVSVFDATAAAIAEN